MGAAASGEPRDGRAGRTVSLLIWGVSSPIFKKFLFPPDPNQRVGRNSEKRIPPIQRAGRRNTRSLSSGAHSRDPLAMAPYGFAAMWTPLGLEAGTPRLHQGFVQSHLKKYFRSGLTQQITSISLAVLFPQRGVSRSSRTLGTGCGGRGSVLRAR